MIFVSVGNAIQGFRRLLNAVEHLAHEGVLKGEDILFQCGHTAEFSSDTGQVVSFLPLSEFEEHVQQAELVIAHAGAGTLIHVFRRGKIPVVMPRQKRYGEHVDDHQMEFATALAEQGRVVLAREADELSNAIERVRRLGVREAPLQSAKGLGLIRQAMEELLRQP